MAVNAYPQVVDALVAQVPANLAAGVEIADGMLLANTPADFLEIGIPTVSESGPIYTGSARQDWATAGQQGARDEIGEVRCLAAARVLTGPGGIKNARDRCAAIMEAVQTTCRADPDLGIEQLLWTSVGIETNWVLIYPKGKPPTVAVEFTVGYRARL